MIVNECNCIVDNDLLIKLIQNKCIGLNKPFKPPYRITAQANGYARICIAHNWFRVHRLIGEYIYGELSSNHIHHKDNNKLNNSIDNLELLSPSEHARETYAVRHVSQKHLKSYGLRMRNIIRRNDVTKEEIELLLKQGYTKTEISKLLKCGKNTVFRRLGMKDY